MTLAREGWDVLAVEAADVIGGGTRTSELTLPGYHHDVCSAIHPMGFLSPCFIEFGLEDHGLEWVHPEASVAHPLDDGSAVLLERSLARTVAGLGEDASAYRGMIQPFLRDPPGFFGDVLDVPGVPRHPLQMARFGVQGLRSARGFARSKFQGERARALFAGCAAHSVLPLEKAGTAAVGLVFSIAGHVADWPMARGGSAAITRALGRQLSDLGGQIRTGEPVRTLAQLPEARAYLFDVAPKQVLQIVGDELPPRYRARLSRYRYGPGAFKVDWALDGPIPWTSAECSRAGTVHLGGTLEELAASEAAAWNGEHSENPFVILCQQSLFDTSRAPEGGHTGWAYCHVPHGSTRGMTDVIEAQVERFAPGFRDRILARATMGPADLEAYNETYVGGAVTGGVADLAQLMARPALRWDPHSTPNPRIFLCSASTPPGGGVHGMCGYRAAQSVLRRHA